MPRTINKPTNPQEVNGNTKRWKPIYLVQIYRMVRLGMKDPEIYKQLRVTKQSFWNWQQKYPELKEAIKMARKEIADDRAFPKWIYSRLSDKLKEVWDKIEELERTTNPVAKIELLLQDNGKRARQQLYLHALCVSRFSPSEALKKVAITKKELDGWINNDLEFAELISEIDWHKANFFEDALVGLVGEGNQAAVIFANKSYNRGRGYSSHTEVDVNVKGSILHGVLDLSELLPYLDSEARFKVLEAIRRRDEDAAKKVAPPTVGQLLSNQIAALPPEESSYDGEDVLVIDTP